MKKLSKVLSLVLVIAMVFSLCVIGASASYADFTDTDKITDTYKEAVDTMTGVGIIDGMTATTFVAQGNFTRAQAAKIVSYMQLGVTAASALKGTGTGYKDVAATAWYAPYVAYCTQQGIIGGYGNGNFGPNDALTGYQWAKMLLCAVGYGVNKEYTGASWSINVAKDALQKGVFDNVLSASTNSVITREQATQMAFNTLTVIKPVTYSTLLGDYITSSTSITGVTATNKTLGELNFNLKSYSKDNAYGVGGHIWIKGTTPKVDKSNIVSGWYQDDVKVAEFTDLATVTAGDLYKLGIKKGNITEVIVNGTTEASLITPVNDIIAGVRGSADKVLAAYNGAKLTLLDTNPKDDVVADKAVISIEYLAKVTKVQAETATAEAALYVTVYNNSGNKNVVIPTEDYDVTGIAKDEYVLVVPSSNDTTGFTAPISIKEVAPVTAAVTAYDANKGTVTFNSNTYGYSFKMNLPTSITYKFGDTYDFYINSIGDVVGYVGNTEATSSLNFAYVAAADFQTATAFGVNSVTSGKVKVVYMDGSAEVIALDVKTATTAIKLDPELKATTGRANTTIAVGDQYFVVKGASASDNVYYRLRNTTIVSDLTSDIDAANTALKTNVFSYSKGNSIITLCNVTTTTGTTPLTAAKVVTSVAFTKGSPVVTLTSGVDKYAKYASTTTNLVLRSAAGTVATVTGYAKFNTMTYFTAAGTNDTSNTYGCTIVAVTSSTGVTNVLVIGATAPAATVADAYGLYVGQGNMTANGQEYKFLVNGEMKSYLLAADVNAVPALTGGTNPTGYGIYLNTNGAIAKIDANACKVGVVAMGDGFVVVDGAVIYTDKAVTALNISQLAAGVVTPDTLEKGDSAYVLFSTDTNGVYHAEAVFISAKA